VVKHLRNAMGEPLHEHLSVLAARLHALEDRHPDQVPPGLANEYIEEFTSFLSRMLQLLIWLSVWKRVDSTSAADVLAAAQSSGNADVQRLLMWLKLPLGRVLPDRISRTGRAVASSKVGYTLLEHVQRLLHNRQLHELGWHPHGVRDDLRCEGSAYALCCHLLCLVTEASQVFRFRLWVRYDKASYWLTGRHRGSGKLLETLDVQDATPAMTIRFLHDSRPAARHAAALAVSRQLTLPQQIDDQMFRSVVATLSHPIAPIRRTALMALEGLHASYEASLMAAVVALLAHSRAGVRSTALAALAKWIAKLPRSARLPYSVEMWHALETLKATESEPSVLATLACVLDREHAPTRRERLLMRGLRYSPTLD